MSCSTSNLSEQGRSKPSPHVCILPLKSSRSCYAGVLSLADLSATNYSSVANASDLERAHQTEGLLAEAHHRAEIRLLGGLDQWNRYYRLKGASMTGHLDDVDDNGDWKGHDPAEKPIGWGARHTVPTTISRSDIGGCGGAIARKSAR